MADFLNPASLDGPSLLSAASVAITRLGLEDEASTEPILVKRVTVGVSMETDRLEDASGRPAFFAWGNHSALYTVECRQLAQYGFSDRFPGKLTGGLLANLRPAFGVSPAAGLCLLTRGSVERRPVTLADVTLEIRVENIETSVGSPDGPSTPGIGGSTSDDPPTVTLTDALEGTIGVAFDEEITIEGTAPFDVSLSAESPALPPGLSLTEVADVWSITGTPTGTASSRIVVIDVSNAYGSVQAAITIVIAAAPGTPVHFYNNYALYSYDSGDAAVADTLWVVADDLGRDATNVSDWITSSLGGHETHSLVGTPNFPRPSSGGATTGTLSGRTWKLLEVLRRTEGADVESSPDWVVGTDIFSAPYQWNYLYRREPTFSHLMAAVSAGLDPVVHCHGPAPRPMDVGTVYVPPSGAGSSWPPLVAPDPGWHNYILYGNIRTGKRVVTRFYGSGVITSGEQFLTDFDATEGVGSIIWTLAPDELTPWYPIEIIGGDGTAYYAHDSEYTPLKDLYDAGKSPWWYLPILEPTILQAIYSSLVGFPRQSVPTLLTPGAGGDPLPSPVGTYPPGVPPSPSIIWYFLMRSRLTGKYWCKGYASRWVPNITDWYDGFSLGGVTGPPQSVSWQSTDNSNEWIIVEIYKKGASLTTESGDGYYYKFPGWTQERIAQCLAHGYSPVLYSKGGEFGQILL